MRVFIRVVCFLGVATSIIGQHTQEFSIAVNGGELHGELYDVDTLNSSPLAILIAGSGPTDRYGSSPGVKIHCYAMLRDSLISEGISTILYDKRTSGKSREAFSNLDDNRFEDFVGDAAEVIKWAKKNDKFSSITVIGHSQGSLVGMLAIQQEKVDKFVSLAGAGERVDTLLRRQIYSPKISEIMFRAKLDPVFEQLVKGVEVNSPLLTSVLGSDDQPFLISWMRYDPQQEIRKLDIPILVVQGTTDVQVGMIQAEKLINANRVATLKTVLHMNHVLKPCPTLEKLKNMECYTDEDLGVSAYLVKILSDFIR